MTIAIARVPLYTVLERAGTDGSRQGVILFWAATGDGASTPHSLSAICSDSTAKKEVLMEQVGRRPGDNLNLFYTLQDGGFDSVHESNALFLDPVRFKAWVDDFGFSAAGLQRMAVGASEILKADPPLREADSANRARDAQSPA